MRADTGPTHMIHDGTTPPGLVPSCIMCQDKGHALCPVSVLWPLVEAEWFCMSLEIVFLPCAGVLSSYGELEQMGSGKGYELAPFDPYAKQPKMSYKVRMTDICAQWHQKR